jgi:hypothetical protein
VITVSGIATTRFFVSTSQPTKPRCMTGVERSSQWRIRLGRAAADPDAGGSALGASGVPVRHRQPLVLRHNRGERKERVDVGTPHLPQSGTELEEFFDSDRALRGGAATS